jgi:hypothetical protein
LFNEISYLFGISSAFLPVMFGARRHVAHGYVTLGILCTISETADLHVDGGDLVYKLLSVHDTSKARELRAAQAGLCRGHATTNARSLEPILFA